MAPSMSKERNNLFDIYFTGELVDGINSDQAKLGFAKLFKTTVIKVNKYFNGKPQLIKRGLSKAEAIKYKTALHQAGLMIAVKNHQAEEPTLTTTQTRTSSETNKVIAPSTTDHKTDTLSVNDTGGDLLQPNEKKPFIPANIDTSAIKLTSPFNLEVPKVNEPTIPAPDTSHLSVANVGADLIENPEPSLPPLPLDLEQLSLAPVGAVIETLKDEQPSQQRDTSHLSLANPGATIETLKDKKPALNPDTSSLKLMPD